MTPEERLAIIQRYIAKMPPLPATVTKVMAICNDPNATPADLNKIISLDPVLMGKVLRLINSAYYGLVQEITSLVRAIIMLGINTVKNLVLSTAVLSTLGNRRNFQALNMDDFWRHSLSVGVASKLIARKRGAPRNRLEEYFIAGLLHDLGKIPLNNRFSQDYQEVIHRSRSDALPLHVAEKASFGIDHADVGRLITDNWQLGADISDTLFFHHTLEGVAGDNREIIHSVALANYYVNVKGLGFSGNCCPQPIRDENFSGLDITLDYLESVEQEVKSEIERALVFLRVAG
jgi:HD-like signal output (HDOD) protein